MYSGGGSSSTEGGAKETAGGGDEASAVSFARGGIILETPSWPTKADAIPGRTTAAVTRGTIFIAVSVSPTTCLFSLERHK